MEKSLRCPGRLVVPEVLEVLLEQERADRAEVVREQFSKPTALSVVELLWPLEEEPASVLQDVVLALSPQPAHFLAPGLVDGLAHELHDVKAIEHVNRIAASCSDDVEKRCPSGRRASERRSTRSETWAGTPLATRLTTRGSRRE